MIDEYAVDSESSDKSVSETTDESDIVGLDSNSDVDSEIREVIQSILSELEKDIETVDSYDSESFMDTISDIDMEEMSDIETNQTEDNILCDYPEKEAESEAKFEPEEQTNQTEDNILCDQSKQEIESHIKYVHTCYFWAAETAMDSAIQSENCQNKYSQKCYCVIHYRLGQLSKNIKQLKQDIAAHVKNEKKLADEVTEFKKTVYEYKEQLDNKYSSVR
jgi:hypothetical protein